MHGTYDFREIETRRIAEGISRFPLPACDIETGAENRVEAEILIEELEVSFGLVAALVTIEGYPDDWSVTSVEIPAHPHAIGNFQRVRGWRRDDWVSLDTSGIGAEIDRAARAWITAARAAEALIDAAGV